MIISEYEQALIATAERNRQRNRDRDRDRDRDREGTEWGEERRDGQGGTGRDSRDREGE